MNRFSWPAALLVLVATLGLAVSATASPRDTAEAPLRAVDGSGVSGTVTFRASGEGTAVSLVVRGLPPRSDATARLHAGTRLDRLSASATTLATLRADAAGVARASARVLFRGSEDVALDAIADGEHAVVIDAGGRVVAWTVVPRPAPPAVARGRGLVVEHAGRIYVEGAPIARGKQPAWSPDGRRIAFVRDGLVFVADRDGGNVRRLTKREPGLHWPASFPAWSPDGARVAFTGTRDLFTVRVADGRLTPLMEADSSWLVSTQAAYSPDGRTIAFVRAVDATRNAVFLMDADGSDVRRLSTPGPRGRLGKTATPEWSPDGGTVVFASNRDGNYELYAIGADGSDERRLTTTADADEQRPRFGRGGARLVYESDGRIRTMRLDGTDVRELGAGNSADWR